MTDSYVGNASSGTLILSSGGHAFARLKFIGDYSIANFNLVAVSGSTVILDPPGGTAGADVLDLASVASAAGMHLTVADLGNDVGTAATGSGTALNLDPAGQRGGTPLAVLSGINTNLQAMTDHNALRLS